LRGKDSGSAARDLFNSIDHPRIAIWYEDGRPADERGMRVAAAQKPCSHTDPNGDNIELGQEL
jgi:hypothetical protein